MFIKSMPPAAKNIKDMPPAAKNVKSMPPAAKNLSSEHPQCDGFLDLQRLLFKKIVWEAQGNFFHEKVSLSFPGLFINKNDWGCGSQLLIVVMNSLKNLSAGQWKSATWHLQSASILLENKVAYFHCPANKSFRKVQETLFQKGVLAAGGTYKAAGGT